MPRPSTGSRAPRRWRRSTGSRRDDAFVRCVFDDGRLAISKRGECRPYYGGRCRERSAKGFPQTASRFPHCRWCTRRLRTAPLKCNPQCLVMFSIARLSGLRSLLRGDAPASEISHRHCRGLLGSSRQNHGIKLELGSSFAPVTADSMHDTGRVSELHFSARIP
jgi:hypothetical protein